MVDKYRMRYCNEAAVKEKGPARKSNASWPAPDLKPLNYIMDWHFARHSACRLHIF